jgi:hypothetical protein
LFELARDGRSAFREVSADQPDTAPFVPQQKVVAAIPQNHDWFDSASTFCRYFVNDVKAGFIGARAPQRRSYFAIALPHDWFVLGFDFALTGDLDRAQYEAFAGLIETGCIPAGAQLILVYPEPTWTRPFASLLRPAYPLRFQRLEHLCAAHGLHVRMRLAGDLHHYVRERLPGTPPGGLGCDLVTCGSGGAFGHATHTREVTEPKVLQWASEPAAVPDELRGRVVLGRVPSAARAQAMGLCTSRGGRADPFAGATACRAEEAGDEAVAQPVCYPDQATSRRQAWGNLTALLRPRGERWWQSNLAFALVLGAGLLVAGWLPGGWGDGAAASGDPTSAGVFQALLRHGLAVLGSPVALAAHAAIAFTALMLTTDNDPVRAGRPERLWGVALALLLMGLAAGIARCVVDGLVVSWWPTPGRWSWAEPPGRLALALLQASALVGFAWAMASLAAGGVVGAFLLLLGRWGGRALTNTSSALSLQGHKGFLRLRVHPGGLEAHMLGLDELPQHWVVRPVGVQGGPARPWWEPAPGAAPLRWRVVDRFTQKRSR